MTTVFIGGSRHITRLPAMAKARLDNVISKKHAVVVGDANGADKAVQKYLADARYADVTVFCSGDKCRNNVGNWTVTHVQVKKSAKGFDLYAMKDRAMAQHADFGLMIWDGKSPGTALNVLRLVRLGKKAVLLNVPKDDDLNFKTDDDWEEFISRCSAAFKKDLRERATSDEWPAQQQSLFSQPARHEPDRDDSDVEDVLNSALLDEDPAQLVDALGALARHKGMSQVAKNAGLARESLYRSLGPDGNPEFATIVKVLRSMGLRLRVSKTDPQS